MPIITFLFHMGGYKKNNMISIIREWHKPDWLYNSLPWLYITGGIVTIFRLYNPIAVFSSSVLIMTGVIVMYWRYEHKRRGEEAAKAQENNNARSPVNLIWHSAFNSGYKVIDQQHQCLFNDANNLIDVITNDQTASGLQHTLSKLLEDIQIHFRDEGKLLEHLNPAIAASHKEIHRVLLKETQSMVNLQREDKVSLRELLGFLIFDVIINHMLREDVKWQEILKSE
ncbi:MAG: hypothetical protein D3925_15090 [Candidatus Electrothrix sp. AR5]|nr:hypothetical protein [Candidatus Electrothrix sp. AR5]